MNVCDGGGRESLERSEPARPGKGGAGMRQRQILAASVTQQITSETKTSPLSSFLMPAGENANEIFTQMSQRLCVVRGVSRLFVVDTQGKSVNFSACWSSYFDYIVL